jgi:hypothetical protein
MIRVFPLIRSRWLISTIGIGLSAFGAVLQEVFYFKPRVIYVSVMFLTVVAYALGEFMAFFIPRWGPIGRFLNPGPFNSKEHVAAVLMASAASVSALSTEALAVQKLFYGGYPSQGAVVFVTLSSQLIGYGIAGLLRETLLWPVKMFYPANLPVTTVLETLHREKSETRKRLRVFWIVFTCLLVWELFPEVSHHTSRSVSSQSTDIEVVCVPTFDRILSLLLGEAGQLSLHKLVRWCPG